jgi:hypothetical protein
MPIPEGPFLSTKDGPNDDGVVVPMEAHNPTIARANDGTYLLFSIGTVLVSDLEFKDSIGIQD